ncbi:MAG: hypothetical protein ACFHVJ_14515 [Aestuariibacter sp.]
MEHNASIGYRAKLYWDFYLLSLEAVLDFFARLPCTIIQQGATVRSWNNSMKRIEMGKSFRDFMLSGKDLDTSGAFNQ